VDLNQKLLSTRIDTLIFDNWDVIINLAAHSKIDTYNLSTIINLFKNNGVFVDGRRFLSKLEIQDLVESGIKYIGVGRSFKEFAI
jgi:hypothetical protein